MAKSKTAFVCGECGAEFPRWQGQCSECKEWNTVTEIRLAPASSTATSRNSRFSGYAGAQDNKVQTLDEISLTEIPRLNSGFNELDRVLGGGMVSGSAILIGGNPGAGKSTLLLQVMCG
ncbi:MAG: DNA repair protein RadA, partial [Gammaproteobacteria bacterium]|nr:DNA repair protein RadA [Gammaproteobacteria bacterium]